MKAYHGILSNDNANDPESRFEPQIVVLEDDAERKLDPCLDLRNHSPDGFAWGYHGSGPAQAALAILADASSDDLAVNHYQAFKDEVIARFPMNQPWAMSVDVVTSWLEQRTKPKPTMTKQDLKDEICRYFNDNEKVCLETVQESLATIIREVMYSAPDCDQ